jgi:hypothetical protein
MLRPKLFSLHQSSSHQTLQRPAHAISCHQSSEALTEPACTQPRQVWCICCQHWHSTEAQHQANSSKRHQYSGFQSHKVTGHHNWQNWIIWPTCFNPLQNIAVTFTPYVDLHLLGTGLVNLVATNEVVFHMPHPNECSILPSVDGIEINCYCSGFLEARLQ